jgi:hypothetical protein
MSSRAAPRTAAGDCLLKFWAGLGQVMRRAGCVAGAKTATKHKIDRICEM